MGRSLALNEAGQHVSLWKARIQAAIEAHKIREEERESLRAMVSELEFPPLLVNPNPHKVSTESDGLEYAHVDQIDMNLMLRYVNKLKAHAGDEQPKITVPRGLGREKIARIEDSMLQRVMALAGANESLLDSIGFYCTDGNCATWVYMPYLPTREALAAQSKDIEQIINEALSGTNDPQPGQDHAAISSQLLQLALSVDPRDAAVASATQDPTVPDQQELLIKAAVAYGAAADDAAGTEWRHVKGQLVVETQPMGEFGTLIDPLSTDLKSARWVARRITMTHGEAVGYASFHPKARKHLRPEPIIGTKGEEGGKVNPGNGDAKDLENENGLVVIWEVWDRENNARYYVNDGVGLYLQVDESYPYVDEAGETVIKAIGTHPGWFPVVCEPLMKPVRRSTRAIDGIPLLKPGKPQQLEIIKLISAMSGAIKRASAGIYLSRLSPDVLADVKNAVDGTIIEVEDLDPDVDLRNALAQVEWKAPSPEIYRQIDAEIARFAISMNFPLAEITSQPMADTATQEEIGLAQGSLGITEILRRLEVFYSHQVWIAQAFVASYYPDSEVAELAGPEGLQVREAWKTQGRLPELPAVKLAAKAKEANPVRVRQLLELYNIASVVPDPMTGFPKYDVDHLLLEAAETLGIGTLPRLEVTPEMIQMQLQQQEQAAAESAGVDSPETPSGEKSEGPDTGDQKKPQPRGSQESSAARRTDT